MSAAPLLTLAGVAKTFGATVALQGVDLRIAAGEILALMGANGAGKSTLVSILGGATRPDQGTMRLGGESFAPVTPADSRRAGIAIVHQATDRAGCPGLTVADALVLDRFADARFPLFLSRRSVRREAASVLRQAGFDLQLDLDFGDLKPAERQLLAIARAVSAQARLLVLDEPTASLSSHEAGRLFDIIEDLRGRGLAIVYISHRLGDLKRLADRVVVLRGGRVADAQAAPIDFERAVTAMIGRPLAAAHAEARAIAGDVVLDVAGLHLGGDAAPIDFQVRQGEVVALTGPLGVGKSRLLSTLFGVHAPAAGTMRLGGRSYWPRDPAGAIAAGVAMAAEDRHRTSFVPSDWPGGTVAGTVGLPHLGRWYPHGFLVGDRESKAAQDGIERLNIRASGPQARLDTLSGGNQQKTILARWQAEPMRLLLLDEPFQGVDVGARADIVAAIRADRGVATLIATSDPEEALEVADRIFVMDRAGLSPVTKAHHASLR
ncbi:sugar ABC transporter ATP-binding protein [Lichenihabitans sp. Uapishka_5]|uniref:sugar ABC transporter ATP-binding protein n=1 Tax=Lichenihabitans sp. Uapishka_5 TaxID=3037302 RepID=UPI0029E8117C|nr:sugar ABC transporter ATP-binding protein [Lichenihabitans sp. Uapishka_5]MDX7950324.1 sugar ABC transporter ATP-binding protein [Lichenihabitans sp. Uapishka_5]